MIPEDVRRFILTAIPSIPYLEAVLLFHRAPDVERSASEVARSLYLSERKALDLLQEMCAAGIGNMRPDTETVFRYAPRDPALAAVIERLAQVYAEDIIGVTHLVHDITSKSAHRFADAFKLRKEP